jgi:hypothetical protein
MVFCPDSVLIGGDEPRRDLFGCLTALVGRAPVVAPLPAAHL